MAYNWTTEWPGVYARHEDGCPLRNGGDCTCAKVNYRASAKAPDQHSRLLSPEFDTALEARDWLRDQRARLTAAVAVAEEGPPVKSVIRDFLAAAEHGEIREPSGAEYGLARVRQMRAALAYVDSEMGSSALQAVRRRNVQALIDQLYAAGVSPQRLIEVVTTLQELFTYAIQRDLVDFNPIVQLRLPQQTEVTADVAAMATMAYHTNGNGNGNGNGQAPVHAPEAPMEPATAPMAPVAAGQVSDEPFDDEPTYGPGMAAPNEPPPPTTPPPPANDPSWPPASDPTSSWAPPLGPPQGLPPMPTPTPTPTPTPAPGYPYDTSPFATPPPAALPTQMVTPIGAETHYGTPTYGAGSVPTQPIVQAPSYQGGSQQQQDGVVMSEQMFWWITRIVVIVFVLIALVLAAESV
jgi:hypothetical protein